MKKKINIVIVFQEYKGANHKLLWEELSKQAEGETLIVDIPADYIVTVAKKKIYRIKEASKGKLKLTNNLSIIRMKFFIRPELVPKMLHKLIAKDFYKQLQNIYGDLREYELNILSYSPKWIDILNSYKNKSNLYYYIYDEIRYNAHNMKVIPKNVFYDEIACEVSKHIFVMSKEIAVKRSEHADKITILGNGAKFIPIENPKKLTMKGTIGFIGNFRNWIDIELLIKLIEKRSDLLFLFAGPIDDNMRNIFSDMLNNHPNVVYCGMVNKEDVSEIYNMVDVVIVPYIQNSFIKATRPIKIVESVFAGTPVVTVPVDGYIPNSFIKFADNFEQFSEAIDYFINNRIDFNTLEYEDFIEKNSWESIAKKIVSFF